MTHDPEVLAKVLEKVLFVAALFATGFPVLYSFSPWYSSWLGRILMLHGIALALALDVTVLFVFWETDNILVYFWVQLFIFTLIALASALMCWMLWRTNHAKWTWKRSKNKEGTNDRSERQP